MIQKEKVLLHFREVVDSYLSAKDSRNIAQLARKAKIGESTLRKSYNQQTLLGTDNMLKVLTITSGENVALKVINMYKGPIEEYLKDAYIHFVKSDDDTTVVLHNIEEHLRDFHKYIIIKRISHCDNVTRQVIKELFGSMGESKLNELIEHEIVFEKDNVLDIKEYSFTLPAHLYGTHCGELIKTFFKSDSALSSKAVIRNISNSVDKNTYNEIMNVVSDVSSKIYNLSKKGPGGIPFAFVGMVDTMEFSIVGEENE